MHTTTRYQGHRVFTSFAADRPAQTVPGIKREFFEDGKRFYETITGKIYIADVYDRNFKVNIGTCKVPAQSKIVRQKLGR